MIAGRKTVIDPSIVPCGFALCLSGKANIRERQCRVVSSSLHLAPRRSTTSWDLIAFSVSRRSKTRRVPLRALTSRPIFLNRLASRTPYVEIPQRSGHECFGRILSPKVPGRPCQRAGGANTRDSGRTLHDGASLERRVQGRTLRAEDSQTSDCANNPMLQPPYPFPSKLCVALLRDIRCSSSAEIRGVRPTSSSSSCPGRRESDCKNTVRGSR